MKNNTLYKFIPSSKYACIDSIANSLSQIFDTDEKSTSGQANPL
jgi:hypothetical protein